MWSDIVFSATAVLCLAVTVATLVHQQWVRRLPGDGAHPADDNLGGRRTDLVRCSVIVPARDEGARLEATIRGLLAQRDVAIDVIAIDDRSTDATGDILRRLTLEDDRVRSVRVESLPDGWLGKCHACYVGASSAAGEWLLFTDADCWLKPDVIARALRVADREAADHITLTPGCAPESIFARAWHLAFLSRLAGWISRVNRDRPGAHLGLGAFNLVRASAYRDCGGYEALRLTIVDDIKLGLLLHRAGKRTRAFLGGDDAECHWGTTVPGIVSVMEKNYFAAADYRSVPVMAVGLLGGWIMAAAVLGPATGTAAGMAAGLAPWFLALPAAVFARRLGWGFGAAALTPILYPVLLFALINSAVVTLRRGGVGWRNTFYPLDTLRKGTLR